MKIKIARLVVILISFSEVSLSQWELRYPDIPSDQINDIIFLDGSTGFFVNSGGSVNMTTDGGVSWKIKAHYQRNVFSEIKFIDDNNGFAISPYSHIGDDVSFIFTTDGGSHWNKGNVYLGDATTFLPVSASVIMKSLSRGSINKLDNFFGNWTETYRMRHFFGSDVGTPFGEILQFHQLSTGRILALGSSGNAKQSGIISDSVTYILKSDDVGSTWDTLWCGLPDPSVTFSFFNDSIGWLGTKTNKIYKTIDNGRSWFLQYSDSSQEFSIKSINSPDGIHVFAVDGSGKFIFSTNGGENWQYNQVVQYNNYPFKVKFLTSTKGFLAGPDFMVTDDGGITWQAVSKSLKGNLTKIDFATDKIGIGVGGRFIYKTSDGGHKWKIVYESPQQFFSYVDVLDSLNIWVTGHDSLFKSADGGNSWFSFKLNNSIQQMRGIQFLNSTVGIVSEVRGNTSDTTFNYVTADGGSSWKKHTINDIQFVSSFNKMKFTDPEHLWFANQYGVWMSKDTAKTWKLIPVEDAYQSFDFIDSLNGWLSIWGGQFKKMAYTTNGGISWETVDKPYSIQTTDVLMYKDYFGTVNTLVAGYDGSLINFIQGDSYSYEIPTYTTNTLQSFAFNKKGNVLHMWAAGDGMTVLHYSVVVTDVKEESPQKISSYCLSQNYPNPFNPSTQIKYQLPQKGFVTLRVYDVLGREVAALVNEQKDPGSYSVQWNASRFASGVYFARLQSGSNVLLKKMILLR